MATKPPAKTPRKTSAKKSAVKQPTPINSRPSASSTVSALEDAPNASVLEHAPHSSVQPSSTTVHPSIEEEIRRRAYELYEERGRHDGFEQQDWARAEEEVRGKYQREKSA